MEPLWTLEFLLAEARRAARLAGRCLDGLLYQAAPHVERLWPADQGEDEEPVGADDVAPGEEELDPFPRRRRRRRRRR